MPTQVKNNSLQTIIDKRRTMVMRLRLRGLTQREIVDALAHPDKGIRNPEGKPWSLTTVNRDIKAIRVAWQERYARDYGEHVARMLAEYREVRREAWRLGDLDAVMKCCAQECKLLGLDQPELFAVADWRQEAKEAGVDPDEFYEGLVQTAVGLLEGSDR